MRRVYKLLVIAAVAGLYAMTNTTAQTGAASKTKFGKGKDSITCIRNLSIYQQDWQQKNYDEAIIFWRKLWTDCPLSSINLTVQGATLYKYYIDREFNADKKNLLIDTLIRVYEKGISLRPEVRVNYQTLMIQDMLKYLDTPDNQPKILKVLDEIITTQKDKAPAAVYYNYMRILFTQNREGKVSDEEILDTYTRISDKITEAIKKTTDTKVAEELAKARDNIDDNFVNSTAARCDNLLKIYGQKYEANKNDGEFLRKLTRMLNRKECTDSELFEKASEQQYALNPAPDAAYNMAMLFLKKGNFEKGVEYFENAIKSETDPVDKSRYNWLLGNIMLTKYNKYNDAKRYALEAIKLRPDWGQPYILLAQTYASGPKCGEDDFEQRQIFWVCVDKLQKARAVDPDVSGIVDPLIRTFSQNFPKKEEGFFRGITEGSSVTVGCWVNEATKVRFTN